MSDEREALARLVHGDMTTPGPQIPMKAVHAADRILAAGWRRSPAPAAEWKPINPTDPPVVVPVHTPTPPDFMTSFAVGGAAQPADAAVIERARDLLADKTVYGQGGAALLRIVHLVASLDETLAALLAEHARAEAAVAECGWLRRTAIAELAKQRDAAEARAEAMERSRDGYEELLLAMQARATAAEAALAEAQKERDWVMAAGLETAHNLAEARAEIERLRGAAERARDTFRRYTQLHLGKGAIDKAAANKEMADMLDAALEAVHGR